MINDLFNIYLSGNTFGKKTLSKLNRMKNEIMFINIFIRLVLDALERYYFENLPETVSERVLKQSLLWYGSCTMFEKNGCLLALPGMPEGMLNVNGDPGAAWVYSPNGKVHEKVKLYLPGSDEDSFMSELNSFEILGEARGVYIRENELNYPFIRQIMFFADAIADTMRTLDVSRLNVKQPYIITCEEALVNSVKKYFEERDNNAYAHIVPTGVFDANSVQMIPFDTNPENIKVCTQLIDWYENKYRELCGFENNAQMDKKGENLLNSEIDVNNQYTLINVDKCVESIQKGLDDVNKLFGTNIKVVRNESGKEEKSDDGIQGNGTEKSNSVPDNNT